MPRISSLITNGVIVIVSSASPESYLKTAPGSFPLLLSFL